jgi:very-short-patch-repair endonuclease
MAAVLACGDGALLSHRSAAELWGLLPARQQLVDVTIPMDSGRRRRGIRVHRSPSLPKAMISRHKRIPVTAPARTVADLRRTASVDDVRRAIREAQFLRLDLGDEAARENELTRTKLERRFVQLCQGHRLPLPEVNVWVGPFEVDFLWREHWLVVETDGWQAHGGRQAFEDDRARDLELKLMGYDVVRFTYRQVMEHPGQVARKLRSLLTR